MQVTIGKEGLTKTWQADFPETTECCRCGGESRIGFVAHEGIDGEKLPPPEGEQQWRDANGQPFLCSLHPNKPREEYWLHDCCAVAVYFCKKCLKATALCNQA